MKEFLTACPRNCYSTCSFRVFTEEGRVVRILPYSGNLATPEGPCIKGLSYLEREVSADRILQPLMKNQYGSFSGINQTEALNIISDRLSSVKSRFGSKAVLFYKGSGMSGLSNDISALFWTLYGGVTTTYGNLCWPAGLEAVRLTLGDVKHNAPWDLANAGLIILWGKNSAETNVQEMIHIDKSLKKGGKLIVIDPRLTPTADKADIVLQPDPGTDAALALAIAYCIIKENYTDEKFINAHVKGFGEFAASLTITPESAEKITGIPAEAIRLVAKMIGTTQNVTLCAGYGIQRYSNGGQTIRALLSLIIITGKIGRRGCGFNYANLQSYVFDSEKEPLSYYPDNQKDAPFRRKISMAKFADDIANLTEPGIKFAWFERGNPVTQLPDSSRVVDAINKIDFKVVVEQFMTDTAAMADIVLPAKGLFEQPDIIGSYWNPYIQFKPAITKLPGEVLPESELYYRLSRLLHLSHDDNNMIPEPGNDNFEKWLETRIADYGKVTLEQLKRGPVLPPDFEEIAYENLIFSTPSGKIELISDVAAKEWNVPDLPTYEPLYYDKEENNMLHLITPNTVSRIHSQFGNLGSVKSVSEDPAWEISAYDAKRLLLSDGDVARISNNLGSLTGKIRINNRIKRGCIIFPNGVWNNEGGGVNTLIKGKETDMGYGAAFHDNLVKVEREKL